MAIKTLTIDWKHVKSYATEKALVTKLAAEADLYPEHNDRAIIVRTPEGRWTAIVQLDMSKGGYLGRYSFLKV
jgi:hypothetical protein